MIFFFNCLVSLIIFDYVSSFGSSISLWVSYAKIDFFVSYLHLFCYWIIYWALSFNFFSYVENFAIFCSLISFYYLFYCSTFLNCSLYLKLIVFTIYLLTICDFCSGSSSSFAFFFFSVFLVMVHISVFSSISLTVAFDFAYSNLLKRSSCCSLALSISYFTFSVFLK